MPIFDKDRMLEETHEYHMLTFMISYLKKIDETLSSFMNNITLAQMNRKESNENAQEIINWNDHV